MNGKIGKLVLVCFMLLVLATLYVTARYCGAI